MSTPSSSDQHYFTTFKSPVGELTLVATDSGLRAIAWPEEREGRLSLPNQMTRDESHSILRLVVSQLREYFAGTRTEFDVPIDLRGTEFQRSAWRALAEIPYGETATYSDQASRIGRPKAVRAIGAANGRNPISIVLPCHRVVGSNGKLVGFAGGLETKRALLELEAKSAS